MSKSLNILFVCTSGKDRSPALVKYCSSVFPRHSYRCAGINRYFCTKNNTHYLTDEDIQWANIIFFVEQIHYTCAWRDFPLIQSFNKALMKTLDCGEYRDGTIGEDYLLKAHLFLSPTLQ